MYEPAAQASGPDTFHVGRLTLTAPGTPDVTFRKAQIADIELSWEPLNGTSFEQWLAHRTSQAKSGDFSSGRKAPLVRTYQLAGGSPAVLFWLFPGQNIQRLEAYRAFGNGVLIGGTNGLPDELSISERLMSSVFGSFKPGTGSAEGFGVEGGSVQRAFENNEIAEASATVEAGPHDHPADLKYSVVTHVYANSGKSTLPDRTRRAEAELLMAKSQSPGLTAQTLRSGPRTVAGVRGDEYFLITSEASKSSTYTAHAEFEYGGEASDPKRPYLQIVFDAADVPRALASGDLLKMWDALLNSARFRT